MDRTDPGRTDTVFERAPRHELELSQGPVRYRDVGSGEPILFVHGALVNGDLWRDVVEPLAGDVRCLVPTLPLGGHDVAMRSDADLTPTGLVELLVEFVDALGLDRVTLVGNDTGGALCQVFLAEHPERVERLVLTNTDAFENFPPLRARPFTLGARVPGLTWSFARALRSTVVRRLGYGLLAKHPIPPGTLASYASTLSRDADVRRDLRKVLLGVASRYTLDAAEAFPAFDRPVLVAWAPEDPIFPLEDAERLVASFPNARLERVEDSYAFVPEDQPEALAELLAGFVGATIPA